MSAFGARTTVIALTVSIALALPAIAQRGAGERVERLLASSVASNSEAAR